MSKRRGVHVRRWMGWATGSVPLSRGSDLWARSIRELVAAYTESHGMGAGGTVSCCREFSPAVARERRLFFVDDTVCLGRWA